MRLSCFICFVFISATLSAQKPASADSLWCDHLRDIVRCVSMKQIYEPVGQVRDSSDIYPFVPHVRLTRADAEVIEKKNSKVDYTAEILSVKGDLKKTEQELDKWYSKIHACLDLWDMARMANRDKNIPVQDYFITNSEDETTVRLTITRSRQDANYHVRITIY